MTEKAFTGLLSTSFLVSLQEIIIAGDANKPDTKQILNLVCHKFLPNTIVLLHEQNVAGSDIEQVVPFIKNQTTIDGKATVYVCENYVCNRPVNKIDDLNKMLSDISRAK